LDGDYIYAKIPEDVFYHQIIIAGKTGSGKTNALKYLSQYFIEELHGAVIAVNVKGKDLLYMNKASVANDANKKEWSYITKGLKHTSESYQSSGIIEHGVDNTTIYVPYKRPPAVLKGIDERIVRRITLSVNDINPQSLAGLMRNLSEIAGSVLPDIFRYWFTEEKKDDDKFSDFVRYFIDHTQASPFDLTGKDVIGIDQDYSNLTRSTINNIRRELATISKYFDAPRTDAQTLNASDLIQKESLSIIHLTEDIQFGSVLLRDIIKKVKEYVIEDSTTPVLFVIDETHLFYSSGSTEEALDDLSTICRTGRQYKISIIFASQDPGDIPGELVSVVASKIFFQSEEKEARNFGLSSENIDIETLQKGFCVVKIKDQPHLKLVKFPKAMAGADNERI